MYDEILIFIDLVNRGGFTEVARHLDINQSTVSRKIQQLEKKLGLILIRRNVRQFELTEHGGKLYELFRGYNGEVSRLLGFLNNDVETIQGKLNVALPITFSRYAISPHISEFARKNPKLRLKLHFHHNEVNMLKENYDIVITSHVPRQQTQKLRIIHKVKIILCCSRKYIANLGQLSDFTSVDKHSFLCQSVGSSTSFNELSVFRESDDIKIGDIKIRSNIHLSNYMHAKIIMKNGEYITAMPEEYVRSELDRGEFIRVLPEYYFGYINFYLLKNVEGSDVRFIKFREFIDDCMSKYLTSPEYRENV